MSKTTKILSIIAAIVLVAICALILVNMIVAEVPLLSICIGIADVLVSLVILMVVIKLCQRFCPNVKKYEPEPEPDEEDYEDDYEQEQEPVSITEEIVITNLVGGCQVITRKVRVEY